MSPIPGLVAFLGVGLLVDEDIAVVLPGGGVTLVVHLLHIPQGFSDLQKIPWGHFFHPTHRRRIKTEEKVVASVREAVFSVLPWTILKNRMNSSFSFKSSLCNSSSYSNCPGAK